MGEPFSCIGTTRLDAYLSGRYLALDPGARVRKANYSSTRGECKSYLERIPSARVRLDPPKGRYAGGVAACGALAPAHASTARHCVHTTATLGPAVREEPRLILGPWTETLHDSASHTHFTLRHRLGRRGWRPSCATAHGCIEGRAQGWSILLAPRATLIHDISCTAAHAR